jgi:hypothetical protein
MVGGRVAPSRAGRVRAGLPLLDLALWLADSKAPVRCRHHARAAADAVEEAMQVFLECEGGLVIGFDVLGVPG